MVAFADASDARQATDRKSISGGVITCAGACGVLVLEDADMCHAFDHRDRRGDIVLLVVISVVILLRIMRGLFLLLATPYHQLVL